MATVLFLHGGGYVAEAASQHWTLVGRLVREVPARCLVPVYPLVPGATAATAVPVAAELLGELVEEVSAGDVVLIGDSAGGGLALATAQHLRDAGHRQPARIVLISPWLDVSMTHPDQPLLDRVDVLLGQDGLAEAGRLWAGERDLRDPLASPLYGSMEGLAPITLFSATRDVLYPDSARLAARARAVGVAVEHHEGPGLFHDYPLMPVPEARRAREVIVRACRGGH
ncbi:MAG TPA: alpha/beta hydrolase [Jiangellales bacterium]|nr:alpha/beta hydrolase [Jiangellales bacterium]